MRQKSYDRGHINEGYNWETDDEASPSLEPNENEPFIPQQPMYHGGGALFGKFREYTMAIRLRHSPLYFGFNIFVLLLTTFLVGCVVFSENHTPRGYLFFFIEVIVTVAVVLDLVVEVSYYGSEAYFTGRGTSHGEDDYSVVRCLSHWFQLVVTALCVISLLLYTFLPKKTGHAAIAAANRMAHPKGWRVSGQSGTLYGPADEDNFVSLFLLLVRYLVYVVFIITSSTRTMQLQGCCDHNKNWEIKLNDDNDDDIIIDDGSSINNSVTRDSWDE
jgi:hypothetical protein